MSENKCTNPKCDETTCQECCPHDDVEYGQCCDCEAEVDQVGAACDYWEGDR